MRGRTQFISFCRSELSRVGPPLKSIRRCGMPCQCRQLAHRMAGLAHDGRERTLGALLERFGRTGTSLGSPVALTAAESQTSCRRRLNGMHRSREIYTIKIDMAYSRQFAHVKKTDKLSTYPRSTLGTNVERSIVGWPVCAGNGCM